MQVRLPARAVGMRSNTNVIAAFRASAAAVAGQVVTASDAAAPPAPPTLADRAAADRQRPQHRQHPRGQPKREHQPCGSIGPVANGVEKKGTLLGRHVEFQGVAKLASRGLLGGHTQQLQSANAVLEVHPHRLVEGHVVAVLHRAAMTTVPQRDTQWQDDQRRHRKELWDVASKLRKDPLFFHDDPVGELSITSRPRTSVDCRMEETQRRKKQKR